MTSREAKPREAIHRQYPGDGRALRLEAERDQSYLAIFGLRATPRPGVSVADLEAAIDGELHRLLRDGVEPDELRRAKERMRAASVYARDSLSGPPNIIGAGLAIGQSLDEIEAWPDRIGEVTPAEVDAAARAVLVERNSATGLLLPEPTS